MYSLDYLIKDLQKALRTDKGLRQCYVANIAMSFYDTHRAYQKHTKRRCSSRKDLWVVSNAAAEYFIDLLSAKPNKNKGDGMYKMSSTIFNSIAKAEEEYDSIHNKLKRKTKKS